MTRNAAAGFLILWAAALLGIDPASAADPARPNVLVVLTDDQGWGDLSLNGNSNLSTPHIDRLARQGAAFDRFFVCPVCSPTRAEFLTGRYHPQGGVWSTSTGGERLDLDEHTIAQTFKAAGYATGAFGKWHNGMQFPYHPNARGFDEYYGFCSGHWGHYFSPPLDHNGRLTQGEGFIADDFTNHAIDFIREHRDQPFFCYLPYCTPHSPMQVPDTFYEKFDGAELAMRNRDPQKEELQHTRAALAMCENIDWNMGRIMETLDSLQLADNTIVVYFCDNGPNGWRWNGGMKGRKGSTDEGGVRSPCIVRWPQQIAPGTQVRQIAGAIDLLPTLADLAGVRVAASKPLDGVSVKPLLLGQTDRWQDRMIFSHWNNKVSVRTQQFRLDHTGQLYDLTKDPGQDHDVSDQYPQVTDRLTAAVADWKQQMLPQIVKKRPFPIGYRGAATTPLPARDGVAHGNIQRSARAPNCSFFTNWTSTDDSIVWDVQVLNPGRYEATVYYTCRPENVGATIKLELGDETVRKTVTEAHDPPLRGTEHDRADRGSESLVKDFKPLSLGTIELPKTRGPLTLRALEIPGNGVIDVRYVMLTPVP